MQAQSAIDNRAVDAHFLFWVAGGHALCTAAEHALGYAAEKVSTALGARAQLLYSGRIFRAMARLDVPTWDDPAVSSQISALRPDFPDTDTVAWAAIVTLVETGSAFIRMFSEALVLFRVLREQGDGTLLVLVSLASEVFSLFAFRGSFNLGDGMSDILSLISPPMNKVFLVWAAITHDRDYIRLEGINRVVSDTKHRKELVAGGVDEYLTEGVQDTFRWRGITNVSAEYCSLADRLGSSANDFWSIYFSSMTRRYQTFKPIHLLRVPLEELPQVRALMCLRSQTLCLSQIIFTLQAVQKPTSIPVSLASLHLLQQSLSTFASRIRDIFHTMGSISARLSSLRKLYEAENIPNKVVDGTTPFPENAQSIGDGISLEFR